MIGTPGRLVEALTNEGDKCPKMCNLKIVILDEADRLLDDGSHTQQLRRILTVLPKGTKSCFFCKIQSHHINCLVILHMILDPIISRVVIQQNLINFYIFDYKTDADHVKSWNQALVIVNTYFDTQDGYCFHYDFFLAFVTIIYLV